MKFKYILLGEGVAKTENGFSGKGNWDLYKCFVKNENGYGEFFINLNRKTGEGEIKMKDTDYSDFLSREFANEMAGITDEIERMEREERKYDVPACIRKGIKLDEDVNDWAEMHGAIQNEDGEWEV